MASRVNMVSVGLLCVHFT